MHGLAARLGCCMCNNLYSILYIRLLGQPALSMLAQN
jgi:hypothetical protein